MQIQIFGKLIRLETFFSSKYSNYWNLKIGGKFEFDYVLYYMLEIDANFQNIEQWREIQICFWLNI